MKQLGEQKEDHQFICGFSMETENLIENGQKKLASKNLDMLIANDEKTRSEEETDIYLTVSPGEAVECSRKIRSYADNNNINSKKANSFYF